MKGFGIHINVSDVSMKFKPNNALSKQQSLKVELNYRQTKQVMYTQRNTGARLSNHRCRRKAMCGPITYSECMSVALVM